MGVDKDGGIVSSSHGGLSSCTYLPARENVYHTTHHPPPVSRTKTVVCPYCGRAYKDPDFDVCKYCGGGIHDIVGVERTG